jgi:hypothetical protein
MRVKAPGDGAKPVDQTSEAPAAGAATGVGESQGAGEIGKTAEIGATGAAAPADTVADVARRLRSGDLSPREAVEILIDDAVRPAERAAIIHHEAIEVGHMARGMKYAPAHELASAAERQFRRVGRRSAGR